MEDILVWMRQRPGGLETHELFHARMIGQIAAGPGRRPPRARLRSWPAASPTPHPGDDPTIRNHKTASIRRDACASRLHAAIPRSSISVMSLWVIAIALGIPASSCSQHSESEIRRLFGIPGSAPATVGTTTTRS